MSNPSIMTIAPTHCWRGHDRRTDSLRYRRRRDGGPLPRHGDRENTWGAACRDLPLARRRRGRGRGALWRALHAKLCRAAGARRRRCRVHLHAKRAACRADDPGRPGRQACAGRKAARADAARRRRDDCYLPLGRRAPGRRITAARRSGVSGAARGGRRRRNWAAYAWYRDHALPARPALLRQRGMARYLGIRRRRRADEPGYPPGRSAAMADRRRSGRGVGQYRDTGASDRGRRLCDSNATLCQRRAWQHRGHHRGRAGLSAPGRDLRRRGRRTDRRRTDRPLGRQQSRTLTPVSSPAWRAGRGRRRRQPNRDRRRGTHAPARRFCCRPSHRAGAAGQRRRGPPLAGAGAGDLRGGREKSRMKLAFSTLGCPDWTLEQCVAAARDYGYDGISLRLLDGAVIEPGIDAGTRRRVGSVLDAAGLPLVCLDTSVKIAQPDPSVRAAQIRDGLAMLDLAAEWQAPLVRVFAGPPPDSSEQEAIASATACLLPLAERAHDLGIAVVLETHDAFCSSAAVMQTLAGLPAAGAGVLWDLLHPYRIGEDPADTLSRIGSRLQHVHIKDGRAPAGGGTNWDFTLLGEGTVPTRAILAMLRQAGYDGWLSVEWEKKLHPELAAPEVALPQHAALLREYLAELG